MIAVVIFSTTCGVVQATTISWSLPPSILAVKIVLSPMGAASCQ
jgi:hypothetical protein